MGADRYEIGFFEKNQKKFKKTLDFIGLKRYDVKCKKQSPLKGI